MIFFLGVVLLCAGNVSSMMPTGGGEAAAGDRRVVDPLETFGADAQRYDRIFFKSSAGVALAVDLFEEDTWDSLKARVFRVFEKDPALFSLRIILGGKNVENIRNLDRFWDNAIVHALFTAKAVA